MNGRDDLAGVATGYGLGLVALPIAAIPPSPGVRDVVTVVVAVLLAAGVAAVFARWAATWSHRWLGVAILAVAALLYSVTPAGASTAIIALLVGAGAGLLSGGTPLPGGWWSRAVGGVLAPALLASSWWVGGSGSSLPYVVAAGTALGAAILGALSIRPTGRAPDRPRSAAEDVAHGAAAPSGRSLRRSLNGVAVAAAVVLVAWTGCNDPQLSWFGPVHADGPTADRRVAITFDDGPNDTASLEVARLLDEHGVKGTFFEVGRAVRKRPDVSRRLVADGHLIGNHSYHHDYYGWLNPLYPELAATQRVIGRDVGVCPRFFRPPHGQRTPLMNLQLARRGMVTVTWNASAGDWATHDARLVARRILERVRPGSVILLHDSLDGHVDADRKVVIEALPLILEGLARKHLHPVRVDQLLGGPAYLPLADCR